MMPGQGPSISGRITGSMFGDVHDKCTRNHKRKRLQDLVKDVQWHVQENEPWRYKLSHVYYEPALTAAVANIAVEEAAKAAA